MKRRTAIRLYRSLFVLQVIALAAGLFRLVSALISGNHDSSLWLGSLVGCGVGGSLAVLWFREWKSIEGISEDQWNRAWFIQPSRKP